MEDDNKIIEVLGKKFRIKEFDDEIVDMGKILRISSTRIEDDLLNIPNHLLIVGILVAKALRIQKKAETTYRIWVATTDKEKRKKYETLSKKYTEKSIETEIHSDKLYLVYKNRLFKAEENYEIMKSLYWSLQKKAEVLTEMIRQGSFQKKLENSRLETNSSKKQSERN